MRNLSKKVGNIIVTITHHKENTFKLSLSEGCFRNGKNSPQISQAKINGNEAFVTKAQIKRAKTILLYIEGQPKAIDFTGEYMTDKRQMVKILTPEIDLYYYFRREECGVKNILQANSSNLAYTVFHEKANGVDVLYK